MVINVRIPQSFLFFRKFFTVMYKDMKFLVKIIEK